MPRKSTDYIAVHCSATPPSMDIGAQEIDRWHRDRGWRCIGYHIVIRRSGVSEFGRARYDVGAHVQGFNRRSFGIVLVGGVDDIGKPDANYTHEQMAELERVVALAQVEWPWAKVQGHCDFPGVDKACPCFDVKSWWANTRRRLGV